MQLVSEGTRPPSHCRHACKHAETPTCSLSLFYRWQPLASRSRRQHHHIETTELNFSYNSTPPSLQYCTVTSMVMPRWATCFYITPSTYIRPKMGQYNQSTNKETQKVVRDKLQSATSCGCTPFYYSHFQCSKKCQINHGPKLCCILWIWKVSPKNMKICDMQKKNK